MSGKRPPLAIGEEWYVKLPGQVNIAVDVMVIEQLTDKTVVMRPRAFPQVPLRYLLKDILFVERVL